jgi:hypothetical protein
MSISQNTKISLGAIIAIVPLIAGAVAWYDGQQDEEHDAIELAATDADLVVAQASYEQNRDVELELIDAKLKLYRMVREHRDLTDDEKAEEEWLKERKRILIEEQRKRRG